MRLSSFLELPLYILTSKQAYTTFVAFLFVYYHVFLCGSIVTFDIFWQAWETLSMVSLLAKKQCGGVVARGDPCTDCAINLLQLLKPAVLNLHNPPKKNPQQTKAKQSEPFWTAAVMATRATFVGATLCCCSCCCCCCSCGLFCAFCIPRACATFFRLLKVFFDFVFWFGYFCCLWFFSTYFRICLSIRKFVGVDLRHIALIC